MKTIVGVRFRHTGKSYYYDPGELELAVGMDVVVRAGDGTEFGTVSIPPMEREDDKLPAIIKNILRIATDEDRQIVTENIEKEKEAYRICKEKIAELKLPMKLIHAEYTFDRKKLLFYFTADGRVDFRELVRVLASVFRTRIELRQVGVRDETRLLGGIGICGRELCCTTYLSGFAPVSIKMAKEQNLSLNPTKISGVCGRLMCCLAHEEETYEYLNRTMPRSGDFATNVDGETGTIRSVNILKQSVLVIFEDGDTREMKEYPVSELGLTPRRSGRPSAEAVAKMQQELEVKLREKLEAEIQEKIAAGEAVEAELKGLRAVEESVPSDDMTGKESGKNNDRSDRSRNRNRNRSRNKNKNQNQQQKPKNKKQDGGKQEKKQDSGSGQPKNAGQGKNKNQNRNKNQNKNQNQNRQNRKDSGKSHRNGGYSRGYRTDRQETE